MNTKRVNLRIQSPLSCGNVWKFSKAVWWWRCGRLGQRKTVQPIAVDKSTLRWVVKTFGTNQKHRSVHREMTGLFIRFFLKKKKALLPSPPLLHFFTWFVLSSAAQAVGILRKCRGLCCSVLTGWQSLREMVRAVRHIGIGNAETAYTSICVCRADLTSD